MSPLPPRKLDPFAALLSYLIPGLGQMYQGRVGKGILFFVSLYVLFFYGMWLGNFKNVYLPHTEKGQNVVFTSTPLGDVENRLHFAGQFPIGVAVWPAMIQYASDPQQNAHSVLGTWQRAPREDELNALQRNGDKRWDLGWVYTVIAGVLNVLVIYDALAGPAVRESKGTANEKEPVAA
jgi:TM2 domain-containing membrane protein YozV